MKLFGYTVDKNGVPVAGVLVEIKNQQFQTLHSAVSNEHGYYEIEADAAKYPFVTAVKDYAVNKLEYWCQNLDLACDLRLDMPFDTLEIYGLHLFAVKGGMNALMVYFRPMCLKKFLAGESDIAPDIKDIRVKLDGEDVPILVVNPVRESIGDNCLTAYLVQVENRNENNRWKRLDVEIWDNEEHFGAATVFATDFT